jgi:hypothetical protein
MDSPRPHQASNGAYFYVNGGLYSKGEAGFRPIPARRQPAGPQRDRLAAVDGLLRRRISLGTAGKALHGVGCVSGSTLSP